MRVLARHDAHPVLFRAYEQALGLLAQAIQEEPVLRLFEKRLLEELGYGPVLEREPETGALIRDDAVYYYQSGKGPVRAKPISAPSIRIHGRTLISLRESVVDEPLILQELKVLMRFLLAPLIGEKPLQVRRLFQEKRWSVAAR
jgi:DNA repair protein RecO (recombination protein O)